MDPYFNIALDIELNPFICFFKMSEFDIQKLLGYFYFTLIERKSRVPQLQGVQGRSRSKLLRALGNAEDGVSSAFPKGKQNGGGFDILYFTDARVVNSLNVA